MSVRAYVLGTAALLALAAPPLLAQQAAARRPVIGVALGGGSARGLAHVGVLRWFEEHRVPVDLVAGTSMGGLIGGAYATGLSADELAKLLEATDWAEMFGSSPYRYRSVARKEDVRAYPSRLELELARGIGLTSALNNGQQVEHFLARLTAPYVGLRSFDDLPTPFRTVALDVESAERVVLGQGSLARALRATMSLPGIFPAVVVDGRLLVDGGAVDNVPASVVKEMGADVVIAVNIGKLPDRREVRPGLAEVVSGTVDALVRANTRRGLAQADVVINPTLEPFGRFDWDRARDLADSGYKATEAMAPELLRYAIDEAAWARYQAARAARRRSAMPVIAAVDVRGATPDDERRLRRRLAALVGHPLDPARLHRELIPLSAPDRYETVSWDLVSGGAAAGRTVAERSQPATTTGPVRRIGTADGDVALGGTGEPATLVVVARPRANAPPLAMFGINVQNLTSSDFVFQLQSRYLALDAFVPRDELRADVAIGSHPRVAAEWRRPIVGQLFVSLGGAVAKTRRSLSFDDAIVAQYDRREAAFQGDLGLASTNTYEVRAGVRTGWTRLEARVGDPRLPSMSGNETQLGLRGIYDTQTHYFTPSGGLRLVGRTRWIASAPHATIADTSVSSEGLVQSELSGSHFWSTNGRRSRVFLLGAAGTSFDTHGLAFEQFSLGLPFRLEGYAVGERRGDHYGLLTAGYLHGIHRLPDFFGGGVFLGGWIENGSAWSDFDDARLETQFGVGLLVETFLGPALVGGTIGVRGERRAYLGFGGIFP